jgi:hypothetical protein
VNVTTKLCRFAILPVVLTALIAACGGSGKKFPDQVVIGQNEAYPVFANTELVTGQNRFALGIIGADGSPIIDADVHLTFYDLNDGKEVKKLQVETVSSVPARDAGVPEQENHVHADGTVHTHFNAGDDIGIYTAMVDFDRPGTWGVEIKVEKGDFSKTFLPKFNVIDHGTTPKVGDDAPRSKNLTVNDVTDITQIDTSANPGPELHTTTIADTIAKGKPALVLFAVPGYCTSRLCGPEIEIMRKLYPDWESKVEMIHVEFYKNPGTANPTPVDTVNEWGLKSEPWFFLIDKNGKIAAKFEGPTSMKELQDAMQKVSS